MDKDYFRPERSSGVVKGQFLEYFALRRRVSWPFDPPLTCACGTGAGSEEKSYFCLSIVHVNYAFFQILAL
jgi:hypothetical protein